MIISEPVAPEAAGIAGSGDGTGDCDPPPAGGLAGRGAADADVFAAQALPWHGHLYAAALRMTGNATDAEDLVQETYAKALAGFGGFQQGTNMRAWLSRIQLNVFLSARRRPIAEIPSDWVDGAAPDRRQHGAPGLAQSAEDVALARMPDQALRTALRALPPHLRTTVYLADAEGLKYAEIAAITRVPLGTVMSRLHRARHRLRDQLAALASGAVLSGAAASLPPAVAGSGSRS